MRHYGFDNLPIDFDSRWDGFNSRAARWNATDLKIFTIFTTEDDPETERGLRQRQIKKGQRRGSRRLPLRKSRRCCASEPRYRGVRHAERPRDVGQRLASVTSCSGFLLLVVVKLRWPAHVLASGLPHAMPRPGQRASARSYSPARNRKLSWNRPHFRA